MGEREGRTGEDSLAYAGLVHSVVPCSTVLSPSLLSPFVLQKYPSGRERESNGVCEKGGESYSKCDDVRGTTTESDRGST